MMRLPNLDLLNRGLAKFRDPKSLMARAAGASAWRLGGQGGSMALRLASNLIMTRLLMPEAFGVMMMIVTIHAGLVMFADIGIRPAIIRSEKSDEPAFLRSAWTMQILQYALINSVLLAISLGIFIVSGYVDFGESVFGDPHFPGLLAFSAVALMMQGLRSTNQHMATRRLDLKWMVMIELGSQVVSIISMIAIASFYPSAWALVWGMVMGGITFSVLTHIILPGPTMALTWNREYAAEIWHLGKWLIGASIFGFFAHSGDRIILGVLLDKETFGLYSIAFLWVSILFLSTQKVMGGVGIAALSEIRRDRPHDLPRAFKRLRRFLGMVGFTVGIGLMLFGNLLIDFLYPDDYLQAGSFIGLLAGMMIFLGYVSVGPMLINLGDSKSVMMANLISCITMMTFVPLAYTYLGQKWAFAFVAINQLWAMPLMLAACARKVELPLKREILQIALIITVFMSYVAFLK